MLLNVATVVIVQELKTRPCPVIFLAFSGAPKACMYKVLQVSLKGFNFEIICRHFVLFLCFCSNGYLKVSKDIKQCR